uniref:XK-related protein n=1 Tax=Globodera pallida TaxID=36090 RepID=A0A183BTT5_GLOPA
MFCKISFKTLRLTFVLLLLRKLNGYENECQKGLIAKDNNLMDSAPIGIFATEFQSFKGWIQKYIVGILCCKSVEDNKFTLSELAFENENKLKLHFYLVLNELLESLKDSKLPKIDQNGLLTAAKGQKRRRRRANIFQNISATFGRLGFGEEDCCKKTVCVMDFLFAICEAVLVIRSFIFVSLYPTSVSFWLVLVFNFALFTLFTSAFVWHNCFSLLNRIGPDIAAVHPEP